MCRVLDFSVKSLLRFLTFFFIHLLHISKPFRLNALHKTHLPGIFVVSGIA